MLCSLIGWDKFEPLEACLKLASTVACVPGCAKLNHEGVGAVERTVCRFKNAAATMRVDVLEAGVGICKTHDE